MAFLFLEVIKSARANEISTGLAIIKYKLMQVCLDLPINCSSSFYTASIPFILYCNFIKKHWIVRD